MAMAFEQIKVAFEVHVKRHTFPDKIIVSPEMFFEFSSDVGSTGHTETIWGIPVSVGEVDSIQFVGGEPRRPWWRFW